MALRPTHRLALRCALPFSLSLAATGCGAGWRTVPAPLPERFEKRQAIEAWTRGQPIRLHGVTLSPDSITGIRLYSPLDCDSCRVALPRAEVDSLRSGDPVAGLLGSASMAILALLGLIYFGCATGSFCPPGVNDT
jgi:hypothetical protein